MANHEQSAGAQTLRLGAVTAWASVLMVMVLGVGAAGLSVATSPGGSPVPTNDPVAAAALRQSVEATIRSRSFTIGITSHDNVPGYGQDSDNELLVYQAPNRCEYAPTSENISNVDVIIIGETQYGRLSAHSSWGEQPVPSYVRSARALATRWLDLLLQVTNVQESSGVYRARFPLKAFPLQIDPLPGVKVDNRAIVTVRHGLVQSENIMLRLHATNGSILSDAVVVTYSEFGTSPPVIAPPASDVSNG